MTARAAGFEGQSNGVAITPTNSDDFGDSAWDLVNLAAGGTVVYRTTDAMHGSVCAEVAGAATTDLVELRWATPFNSTTLAIQLYFKFGNVAPSSQIPICMWRDTSGTQAGSFSLSTTGRLVATQTSSGTVITATNDARADIAADTWYRVDGVVTRATTTTGRLIYQLSVIDGPPKFYYDSGATLNFGSVNLGRTYFGKLNATPTWSGVQRFDSLRVDDARTTPYDPVTPSNAFPVFTQQNFEIGTSLGSTNAVPNPPNSVSGDLVLQTVSNDNTGATDITASTGWTPIHHDANGTLVKLATFGRVLDGGADDACSISGASQDYAVSSIRFPAGLHGCTNSGLGTEIKVGTAATGLNMAANPPSLDAGSSKNWMWLAVIGYDWTSSSDAITADPTNYKNVCWLKSSVSASSCGLAIAWRQNATQTEDPGTFTNTNRSWVAQTLAIPPVTSGSGSPSQEAQTASGSGSAGTTTTGTGTPTQAAQTAAGAGVMQPSGSAATTQANQTANASGSEAITATGTPAQDNQTSTASGYMRPSGTAAVTQANQIANGAGSEAISGSGTPLQAAQTAVGSGTHTQTISGSGTPSQASQTSSGSGVHTLTIAGSGAVTQTDQTSTGSAAETLTGAGALTQASQTASGVGILQPSGTGATTQASQTAAGVGSLGTSGAGASTQANQTASGVGETSPSGSGSPTQASQTSQPTATVPTSTSGVGGPGTSATVTFPSYTATSRLILILSTNQAITSVGVSGGATAITSLATADNRVQAFEITPNGLGQANFGLSWTTSSYYQWVVLAVEGAFTGAEVDNADNIGSNTTSAIAIPSLAGITLTTGNEVVIQAAGVNATGTYTAQATAIYTSNTTSNAALQVLVAPAVSGQTTLTFAALDRGLAGTTRNESAISLIFYPSTSAAGVVTIPGSGTPAQADQTSNASAVLQPSGSAAATQDDQTANSSGIQAVAGSATVVQADQTATATGILQPSGAGAATQENQTASAVGALGDATFGTAGVTQAAQTASGSGSVSYTASGIAVQDDQTANGTGSYVFTATGTGSAAQDDQTSTAAAVEAISGSGAANQDDQTSTTVGLLSITGTGSGSGEDGTAGGPPPGEGALTQADQVGLGSGLLSIAGAGSGVEGDGTAGGSAPGTGTVAQADQVGSGSGVVTNPTIAGSGSVQQTNQTGSGVGVAPVPVITDFPGCLTLTVEVPDWHLTVSVADVDLTAELLPLDGLTLTLDVPGLTLMVDSHDIVLSVSEVCSVV